ncbi:OmpA family protein [Mucilaginibacter conchicola]|uniref:OmpA family protein n=1 Tax=Mucilaginibacter conchicola TaxID=2303333 RepID=A0A372NVT4_9SPHI|nr:OmpA family protein [Mucilaginibacter conchicola]RFZ94250.1 OmpA family protein [Mucilaginibacter conchicola]
MAQLDVQPKKHSSAWLLIIFLILAAGAAVLLYKGCNKSSPLKVDAADTIKQDTAKLDSNTIVTTQPDWSKIDFNIPASNYEEVTDTAVIVKGNDHYTIYSLGENILFKKGDSKIMPASETALQQVVTSLIKRYKDANIGVYGHTDSIGNTIANKNLGAARAEAVKDWLTKQGRLPVDQISIHSMGEQQPVATNATEKGRALNRSVEIVAFPDKAAQ